MIGISQTYAIYHRRKYGNVGYLYQGRYKCRLIDKEEYLLECGRYIERNPLRANLVTDLSEYRWSSYHYYANGKDDSLVSPDALYDALGRTTPSRRRRYAVYLAEVTPYESIVEREMEKTL